MKTYRVLWKLDAETTKEVFVYAADCFSAKREALKRGIAENSIFRVIEADDFEINKNTNDGKRRARKFSFLLAED